MSSQADLQDRQQCLPLRPWEATLVRMLSLPLMLMSVWGCFQNDYSNYKTFGDGDVVKTAPEASSVSETQPASKEPTISIETSNPESSVGSLKDQESNTPEAVNRSAEASAIESVARRDDMTTPVRPETKASSLRSDLIIAPETGAAAKTELAPASALQVTNSANTYQAGGGTRTDPAGMPAEKPSDNAAKTALREVKVLIPDKQFTTEGKDQALRVSYDDLDLLKVLNMEPVTDNCVELMPDWLKQLNGQKIRIRGFMYPTFEATGITEFVLARDNQICCFGRNPKVYDLIGIKMAAGKTTNYIPNRPFDVTGTFVIEKASAEGEIFGLYWIRDAVINER